ncbi:unnamed protein product [Strongylus vulgaris]|uniref:Uncharacterized protein n=1 Tax=Strongylus vulgaris TaxID=40348 RepID=A0A3P7JHR8_STRVU|nr:unnamed protein product [Strongylus vulgaris]
MMLVTPIMTPVTPLQPAAVAYPGYTSDSSVHSTLTRDKETVKKPSRNIKINYNKTDPHINTPEMCYPDEVHRASYKDPAAAVRSPPSEPS